MPGYNTLKGIYNTTIDKEKLAYFFPHEHRNFVPERLKLKLKEVKKKQGGK